MGWASGSRLAEELYEELLPYIKRGKQNRQDVAKIIVDSFEDHDADDWSNDKDSLQMIAYPERMDDIDDE